MELKLLRRPTSGPTTIGSLYLDKEFFCYTLEDPVREVPGVPVEEWKIKGETAIPYGRYRVVLGWSPKFQMMTPRLEDVPGYEGVLIHPGNYARDTEGCILPGMTLPENNMVGDSRRAFNLLNSIISRAIQSDDEVWLNIKPEWNDV